LTPNSNHPFDGATVSCPHLDAISKKVGGWSSELVAESCQQPDFGNACRARFDEKRIGCEER
jgi:hypothetical protein